MRGGRLTSEHDRVGVMDPRLRPYARGYLAVGVGLGVAGALLVVAQASLLADAITAVFQRGAGLAALRPVLLALAAVVLARSALVWAQELAAHRAASAAVAGLRDRLLAHVVRLGPAWLTSARSGELTALATRGVDALDGYFARYLPQVVLAVVVPVVVLARIFPADLLAGATIVVTLPLIPLFMALVGRGTREANRRQFRQLSQLSHHFLDVVTGLATLRLFRRAAPQSATIATVTDRYRRLTMRTLRFAFLSGLVLDLLATLSVALVAVGIGLRLVAGSLDLRTGLLVLLLAPEAYLPLRALGAQYHASAEGRAAADEVFAVLDQPVSTLVREPTAGGIELADVTVRYAGRDQPALESFSLSVAPGETVALTGPSGAGKSTVLALLLGFIAPDKGHVCTPADISWLPQAPYLFAGTVAENLRLGAPAAGDTTLAEAVELAGATPVIAALPQGLHTAIGDGGRGLSAGERQRIALARALVHGAPVLLLDEPTASLDEVAESTVVSALAEVVRGRTVILVAHRPAVLALADRVVTLPLRDRVIDDGVPA
jgi:thiol reductant ABC exporter CydD subunit